MNAHLTLGALRTRFMNCLRAVADEMPEAP
jgi:hypothetical protein